MRICEITEASQIILTESIADRMSKSIMTKAMAKFRNNKDVVSQEEGEKYLAKKENELEKKGVDKKSIQKFFGLFRKHPRLIGLAVIILMLISPLFGDIDLLGLSLEKIVSMTLAGLYTIDIALPLVKTHFEQ